MSEREPASKGAGSFLSLRVYRFEANLTDFLPRYLAIRTSDNYRSSIAIAKILALQER